eukprot:48936-Chlamydomonas_euryale.AAC.1
MHARPHLAAACDALVERVQKVALARCAAVAQRRCVRGFADEDVRSHASRQHCRAQVALRRRVEVACTGQAGRHEWRGRPNEREGGRAGEHEHAVWNGGLRDAHGRVGGVLRWLHA